MPTEVVNDSCSRCGRNMRDPITETLFEGFSLTIEKLEMTEAFTRVYPELPTDIRLCVACFLRFPEEVRRVN